MTRQNDRAHLLAMRSELMAMKMVNHSNSTHGWGAYEEPIDPKIQALQGIIESLQCQIKQIREENHDLKNVVTPLKLMANMLMRDVKDAKASEQVDCLRTDLFPRIEKICQRIESFANGAVILDSPAMESVDITQLLAQFIHEASIEFKMVSFNMVSFYSGPVLTHSDYLLNKVVMNAVINSVQAIERREIQNGQITFYIADASVYGQETLRPILNPLHQNEVVVVCSDNAGGISKTVEPMFFWENFTYGEKKGSGIGTASIKRIVENDLSGRIALDNQEGFGLALHIGLPKMEKSG